MVAVSLVTERTRSHSFYVSMAAVFVLIAFGGFTPTYWTKIAAGNFHGAPIMHIHGAMFFFWTLFFFAQTALVATGRTPDHRKWGLAGISLGTAMAISVVLATINSMKVGESIGMGDQARQFAIVPLGALVLFVVIFTLAIANIRRNAVHKRLMLMSMIPLMQAALARVFRYFMSQPGAVGPPPVFAAVPPGITADLLVVAAIVYDWRTRGRPHKVYLICGTADVAEQLLCWALGPTATWMAIAAWVESLAG
ncbi:MAG: hypothetical protein JWM91_3769 [Rhodospirillales bacterium]|nr:hypothetical protein [Rhodospirillales bacterium]